MKSKLLTALLSLAIAVGVWLYVVTVVSPNSDKTFYDIKVETMGEKMLHDQGLMITNIAELPTITLHLEGSRIDLNKLSSDNINITLDVSKISDPGVHDLPYSITYPTSNAFVVLNKTPGSVRVYVEERISKSIPVEVKLKGDLPQGYDADLDNKTLSVETVTVTGPKSVIDQIAVAKIEPDVAGKKESLHDTFTYTLCNAKGAPVDAKAVVTDVADITLALKIAQKKTIQLGVNLISGGGATKADCTYSIDAIEVFGSEEKLNALGDKLILGDIDLAQISENANERTFTIALPEGVDNLTGVKEVKVTITFPDLAEKTLSVKQFEIINEPQGLKAEVITEKLKNVTLRGPVSVIEALTEENVVAVVDFTGATEETKILKVTFKCGENQLGIVVVDPEELNDEVTVNLSKKPEQPAEQTVPENNG